MSERRYPKKLRIYVSERQWQFLHDLLNTGEYDSMSELCREILRKDREEWESLLVNRGRVFSALRHIPEARRLRDMLRNMKRD